MTMARIISIDGNIGAGKSTVLDALEARLKADGRTDVYVLREPVDRWIALQLPPSGQQAKLATLQPLSPKATQG